MSSVYGQMMQDVTGAFVSQLNATSRSVEDAASKQMRAFLENLAKHDVASPNCGQHCLEKIVHTASNIIEDIERSAKKKREQMVSYEAFRQEWIKQSDYEKCSHAYNAQYKIEELQRVLSLQSNKDG